MTRAKAATKHFGRTILGSALIAGALTGCGGSTRVIGGGAPGGGSSGAGGAAGGAAGAGAGTFGGSAGSEPFGGAGGATSDAGSAGSIGDAGGPALSPGSWNVTAQLTIQGTSPISVTCPSLDFTLNISPDRYVTVGHDGQMAVARAQLSGGYSVDALTLPTTTAGCSASSLQVTHLHLERADEIGASPTNGIVGSADGTIQSIGGDIIFSNPVSVVISGVPDHEPPQLSVLASVLNPLAGVSFPASEPLDLKNTSLQLVGSSTVPLVAQPSSATDGVLTSSAIAWAIDTILPLSGEWTVQGSGADLIGLELGSMGTLRTLKDPGVFAQDGFESPLIAAIDAGSPQLVSGVGSLPAIEGAQSLLLGGGTALTFHLRRAATESSLRFSVRALGSSAGSISYAKQIRVGVVGSAQASLVNVPYSNAAGVSTGDATFPWASALVEVSVPLDSPGQDVLVSLADFYCGGGLCPPPSTLLLDQLRLE